MSESQPMYTHELELAKEAARAAGSAIRDFYDNHSAATHIKKDGSVVTDADLAADGIIRDAVRSTFPGDALLTEEGADDQTRLGSSRIWIIDPIDGTNQFVDRTGEFDVLIALVVDDRPVVGVTYQPTTDLLLSAISGHGATIEQHGDTRPLRFSAVPQDAPPRLMTSVWLGYPDNMSFMEQVAIRLAAPMPTVSSTGISIRRIMPDTQEADAVIGYRVGEMLDAQSFAWEWDFAAPDVIIHEAGGSMTDLLGHLHRYNKPVPRNDRGVIFCVDPLTDRRIVDAITLERAVTG